MDSTKLSIVLRTAYSKKRPYSTFWSAKKQCDDWFQSLRCFKSIIALFQLAFRIVFFLVFKNVFFVRNLYGSCLMPMRANKKNSGFSRLGEESRSFYMFRVVSEWRL